MKKKLIKFLIAVSILLTTFNTNILAQNRISGEKLEKLLTENYIIIYDFFGPLRNNDNIEINFDAGSKTYSLKGSFPLQQNIIHPRSGTWEIVGFGKSIVRLDDIQNQNQYTNQNARIQLFFGDDGNIYNINQKLYSYRLENKKERIENNARRIEEERKAEELRLKKIEEEKRQLAIKREQERIKQEQERIKQEEEKKRFQAEVELILKKDKERREEKERKELYASIVKYSLLGLFLLIISFLTYKYKSKIFEYKSKIFLNLEKSFKSIKENSIKTTKDISEKKTSKKNINPIIEKPIRIKDGITDPMHCQICGKKTKHYVSQPFPALVVLAMMFLVIGIIIAFLAQQRLTCSKCGNSYIRWGL
jgi:hypothetical protein